MTSDPPRELGERELLRACADGRRDALAAVHRRFDPELRTFLLGLRLGLRREEIDDAVQECFLRLFQSLAAGRTAWLERGRPLTWVLGIARHVALDICRRPRTAPLEPLPAAGGDAAVEVARSEERELTARALAALEPRARALLVLRHLNKLKMAELAEVLECSLPTARARLREAAASFATELRRQGIHPRGGPR